MSDPLPLAQALVRCPSVTPEDGGAQAVLGAELERLGFGVTQLPFGTTPNLFARLGTLAPHLCFAGHTDVVPPGQGWSREPFAGAVVDGKLVGRGACDMKGAIAAFVAAVEDRLAAGALQGSVSLLITGDEEGPATDGTVRVLDWMEAEGQVPDFCLVGEPTNPVRIGEVVKIGRRGSLNAAITVHGTQGHAAYPQRADNPVHRLVRALAALTAAPLDAGSEWFEPSTLQVTSIDVGNPATNVIPAQASARLNMRFNDRHTGAGLEAWLRAVLAQHAERFDLRRAGQRRELPDRPRRAGGGAAPGDPVGHRDRTAAGHRRRHVGCPVHRPVLPRRGVRPGGRHDAYDGRARAGRRPTTAGPGLPRRAGRFPTMTPTPRNSLPLPGAQGWGEGPPRSGAAGGRSCGGAARRTLTVPRRFVARIPPSP